ncbi:hypothetical protein MMC07_008354 [Pseudocyphellaria aurata]|nr:hypothetical protein [Pseudocyphellaria aurata]
MGLTTRLLELESKDHDRMQPIQILFSRMALTSIFGSIYLRYLNIPHYALGAKGIRFALVIRGVAGFMGVYGLYYSLQYLPLAEATVLAFLGTLLGTWLSSWIRRSSCDSRLMLASLFSFVGVILIAQPSSIFFTPKEAPPSVAANCTDQIGTRRPLTNTSCLLLGTQPEFPETTPAQRISGVLAALAGVLGTAVAHCATLWIGKRAHPLIISNYFAVFSAAISGVLLFFVSDVGFRLPVDGREYFYLIATSVCGYIMQFLFVKGLQYEESNRPANMVYTHLLFALAFDKLIWNVSPGALSITGVMLILSSVIYVAVFSKSTNNTGDEEQVRHGGDDEHIELLANSHPRMNR